MHMISRIKDFYARRKRNAYLEQHGYYDSFDERKYERSFYLFPHMPYSLSDILAERKISGKNILVLEHTSTAYWFNHSNNIVTLARLRHGGGHHSSIRRIESYGEYDGPPIDILIWDNYTIPKNCEEFVASHLAPRGVVIMTHSHYFDAMELGMGYLGDHLMSLGMRMLTFQNPGPRRELMTAELYYPQDNVLDI